MKKNFLFLPLAALAGSTLLVSCNAYLSVKDGALIKIGDKEYSIQDIYDAQRDTAAAAESYYNLLDNVYTQLAIPVTSEMEAEVDEQMQTEFYDAAEDNARDNATTVSEEKENLLAAANVDSEEEYREKLILEAQKTAAQEEYVSDDNVKNNLLEPYIEKDSPYHVKHILVDTSATSGEYHRATITSDEALHLGQVVTRLASGNESFGDVAHTASDDDSSSPTYGDLGIMDKNTSFVSEFKLGDFVWDMKYNNSLSDDVTQDEIIEKLGPSESGYTDFEEDLESYSLFGIPYSSAIALTEMYDIEHDETGHTASNSEEENYPRNVIFNSFYNNHSMSLIILSSNDKDQMQSLYGEYITDDDVTEYGEILSSETRLVSVSELGLSGQIKSYAPVLTRESDGDGGYTYSFSYTTTTVPDDYYILTDEQGNPILVTRAGNSSSSSDDDEDDDSSSSSYEGVHFIVNQRDPFMDYSTSITDYYNVDVTEALADENINFVNYIKYSATSDYNDRASELKSAIQEEDLGDTSNSTFDIYENTKKLSEEAGYTVHVPDNIQTLVDAYIDSTEALNDYTNTNSYDRSWTSYFNMLDFQQDTISLNLPISSLDQFGNGNIPVYIDLTQVTSNGTWTNDTLDFTTISADAYTNTQPDGTYGVGWIYNPAYVGSSTGWFN